MMSNYFKIAIRSLIRFQGYAAINLIGLSLGLTAGIMILLYVMDELSYDNFHTKIDRIYRVESQFSSNASTSQDGSMETNGWGVGNTLRKDFPEVEAVLYSRRTFLMVRFEGRNISERIHFASPEFFQIFDFPLKKGNVKKCLTDPYSVVITEEMEKKYFPGQDALDQILVMADTLQFVVTGVMESIPVNSHIQVDMLISFATYQAVINPAFDYDQGWGNINMRNYVLLKEGINVENFKAKAKNIYAERAAGLMKEWGVQANVVFTPLKTLYLTAKNGNGFGPLGSLNRIYLISGIALFVILLACINFINLTTARSVYRAREVGVRKLSGSSRVTLISQFLCESFLLTLMGLIIAIAFTTLLLPFFNQLLAKNYSVGSLLDPAVALAIIGLLIAITILSGYYPAWVMSGMRPVQVLKGKLHTGSRAVKLRRALVIFQFAISVSLVLGTFIVMNQLNYMQQQDLGFNKDQVFVLRAPPIKPINPNYYEAFKDQIQSLALVEDVSYTSSVPGTPGWQGQMAYPEGRSGDDAISVEYIAVDDHFINTMGLEILAGRGFDKQRPTELKDGLILNETAAWQFGWGTEEAIGKKITSPSGYPEGKVIAVVRDYHQFGLQQEVGPITMDFNPENCNLYAIRYKGANTQELITLLNALWQKNFPAYDFNYLFLSEDFERQYQSEQRLAQVLAFFAVVTIVIAVIGLLGLVSFMVATRTKELGVRKVLGASVLNITSLLSKEFVVLIVVANIIAIPLVWHYANQWLQNFANRDVVDPMVFVFSLLITLSITLLTISIQTVKAALTDPVKSLRYE
jgi:putative ABC transport system permease protein